MPIIGKVLLAIGLIIGFSLALAAGVTVFVFHIMDQHGISPGTSYSSGHEFEHELTTNYSFDATGKDLLKIDHAYGEIFIEGWDEQIVEIAVTKKANSESKLEEYEVKVIEDPSGIEIRSDDVDEMNFNAWRADMVIKIPASFNLLIDHGVGKLHIENLSSIEEINIDFGVGECKVVNVEVPSLRIDAGVGEVFVQNPFVGYGAIDLGIGELDFRIQENSEYDIEANVGIGDLNVYGYDYPGVRIERHGFLSREAKITMGAGTNTLVLEVGMGELSLRVLRDSD